ncbi:hypothetical protein GCM10009424_16250 [Sphingomonas ursincola]
MTCEKSIGFASALGAGVGAAVQTCMVQASRATSRTDLVSTMAKLRPMLQQQCCSTKSSACPEAQTAVQVQMRPHRIILCGPFLAPAQEKAAIV